ncbi:MAG TPA: hypothetical protein VJ793_05710 [Anaerolineae bacterium]|nr:hypothetical protein [Anaerolineae bacterium]
MSMFENESCTAPKQCAGFGTQDIDADASSNPDYDFTPNHGEGKGGFEIGAVAVVDADHDRDSEVYIVFGEDKGNGSVVLCCNSRNQLFPVQPGAIRQVRWWASLAELFPTLFEYRRRILQIRGEQSRMPGDAGGAP